MFIFSHRSKIETIGGFNFCSLVNPISNEKIFQINRIEFDAAATVEIQIFVIDELDSNDMVDISDKIQDLEIDDNKSPIVALGSSISLKVLHNPIKNCKIIDGYKTTIIYPDEKLLLPPGKGILIRAFSYEGNIVGNSSITFKKITKD